MCSQSPREFIQYMYLVLLPSLASPVRYKQVWDKRINRVYYFLDYF